MPVVFNVINRPASQVPSDAAVVIELVGENGRRVAGYVGSTDVTVEGAYRPTVDASFRWEATLVANSLVSPAGTMYKVSERVDDGTVVHYITVPTTTGPHYVLDILEDGPPAALASAALQNHLDDTSAAHAATAVSFAPAAGIAATDVQAAIVEDAGDLAAHLADTSDAHDASAISAVDAGGYYTGTELEAVTQEIGASLALKAPLASPTFTGTVTLADAVNVVVNATTGTKIGTATTQKLGFFNATPVVQPAGTTDVLASLVTLGLRAASSNPPLDLGTGAVTAGAISGSGQLAISGGNFRVDSSGRIGSGGAISGDTFLLLTGTHANGGGNILGFNSRFTAPSTAIGSVRAFQANMATAAASFTLTNAYAFYAEALTIGAGSSVTNTYGLRVENLGQAGVTNSYGVDVAAVTGAATLNIAARLSGGTQANLWLNSDTATEAGGIAFGTTRDVNLYRRAANELRTDDKLLTNVGLGVGNSAAATTPGTVTKKIEVFDAVGASIGFLPVYDAIT